MATAVTTRRLTYAEALVEAIAEAMRADRRVFFMGQDVGRFGGALQGARGLFEEFGAERVRETPIAESAMVGAAIGAALFGQRPIVEIPFGEFIPCAMNQLVLQAPLLHYMTAGKATVPVVVRTRVGDGPYGGHPQDYVAWFLHVPGWKVVVPSNPLDAKGLMHAAILDDNPVFIFEPMSLYHAERAAVPAQAYVTPIGQAAVRRQGSDVTVIAFGSTVPTALHAAEALATEHINVEVMDLRTLVPLDMTTLASSVRKTGRVVIVHEAWVSAGVGSEILARLSEENVRLLAAPRRIGALPIPVPSGQLRRHALPNAERVAGAIHEILRSS